MVGLLALFALPAAAHAEWMSAYPVATHGQPSVIAVDLFGGKGLLPSAATIAVRQTSGSGSFNKTYTPGNGLTVVTTATGYWSSTEVDNGGYYTIDWTWVADSGNPKATLYAIPSTMPTGTFAITATIDQRIKGSVVPTSTTWTFTLSEDGTPPPGGGYDDTNCTTNCHRVGGMAGVYAQDYVYTMGRYCTECHSSVFAPLHGVPTANNINAIHATLISNLDHGDSKACTACHGDDVLHVASRLTTYGVVTVPADQAASFQGHQGCSCHRSGEVTLGANQTCADCHDGGSGIIHGFAVQTGSQNSERHDISGHNTAAYPNVGGKEGWASSGVTDTANHAPSAAFPFPVQNVFWANGDPQAPSGAITGLTKSSVVACEDCHTALSSNELAGPHGGSAFADFGLDPAFPGSFETAFLYGGGDANVIVDPATGRGIYSATAAPSGGTTFTTTSGLAQYVPRIVGGETGEELADWDLASGAAHIETGTVICVKCHDLYNRGAGKLGWSNYGHEHHADRPVKFGKYNVGDGGVSVTTQTVYADTAAHAIAEVPGATKDVTITAPSLGRETAGACRDCHIAIPHGWKRPRLIVYSNLDANGAFRVAKGLTAMGDSAPYNVGPSVYEGEPLSGTAIGSGQMNGLSSTIAPVSQQVPADGTGYYNQWSSSQCNGCGHHSGVSLTAGDWK